MLFQTASQRNASRNATLRTKPGGRSPLFRRGNACRQSPRWEFSGRPVLLLLIPLQPLTCAAAGARRREQPSRPRPRGLAAQLPHRKTRARPLLIR